jgi:DNA-binding NtrC family response regulator
MDHPPPHMRRQQPMDRLRVLLVDDDTYLLHALKREFRRLQPGWIVVDTSSIPAAMRMLKQRADELDVAVCDIGMPDLPGTKLLKLISNLFPHIVRISLSGMLDGPSLVGAGKYAECQICKPIPAEQLCAHIVQSCRQRQVAAGDQPNPSAS